MLTVISSFHWVLNSRRFILFCKVDILMICMLSPTGYMNDDKEKLVLGLCYARGILLLCTRTFLVIYLVRDLCECLLLYSSFCNCWVVMLIEGGWLWWRIETQQKEKVHTKRNFKSWSLIVLLIKSNKWFLLLMTVVVKIL